MNARLSLEGGAAARIQPQRRAVDVSRGLRRTCAAVRVAEPDWSDCSRLRAVAHARRWYLARVTPGREKRAVVALWQAGLEAAIPVDALWRHASKQAKARGDAKVERLTPALPGYALVGFEGAWDRWVAALSCDHVNGFVSVQGAPRRLSGDEAIAVVALGRAAPRSWRRMLRGAEFAVGDAVRMMAGPLEGWRGVALSIDLAQGRALVDLEGADLGAVWAGLDALGRAA